MARIRTIKPEFFLHEGLYELERETGLPIRLAFAGLWCHADREGRFAWRPRTLKHGILPYDDVDFSRVLDSLESRSFVLKYESAHGPLGVIPTFLDHQVINYKEGESKLPPPPARLMHGISCGKLTRASRVGHATGTRDARKGKERKGREGKGKEGVETTNVVSCSEPLRGDSEPAAECETEPPVMVFPVVGKPPTWPLTAAKLAEYQATFPHLAIEAECRKARQWCEDHPPRRKTARGMPGFLFAWLERTQNSNRNGGTNDARKRTTDRGYRPAGDGSDGNPL